MASLMIISCFELCILLVLLQRVFITCGDYLNSRATFYGSSDALETDSEACVYGSFRKNLNGGDFACASQLYRGGLGCWVLATR